MRSLFALFILALPAFAQERTHDIVPEDYFTLNGITEIAVSPDGKHVAYGLGTWSKADDTRRTDIWIVPANGKADARRITLDRANDRHIQWSVNMDCLYFLGNRKRAGETKPPYDGSTQVWKVKLARIKPEDENAWEGLEPRAVTTVEGGVTHFDYAANADCIFYSFDKTHHDQDEFAKLRAKTKVEYGHGVRKVSEIHKLNMIDWRGEKVVDEIRYIRSFAVTRDGKKIAMVSAFDDTVVKSEGESRVDVWEAGKVVTPPTDSYRKNPKNSPYAWLENLCWNPKGDRFAFTAVHDAFPAEIIVGTSEGNGWKVLRIERQGWAVVGYGRGLGQPLQWAVDDALYGLVEDRGLAFVARLTDKGAFTSGPDGVNVLGSDMTTGGQTLIAALDTQFPVIRSGTGKVLADTNPHTSTWKLPSVQHIYWKAPDGTEVGGVLELPYGYKKGDKLPLVVAIHGGPTTSTKADLNFDPHNGRLYFAAAGYAVLFPNYRGSTGYGDKFVTDLIGRENDIEVKDILAGIQHLVKEGIADENRVGVMGWSNGGYLTNCLITLKDSPIQFKAASSGAGIVDTVAEWGFNDEPAYPIVFKKGLPWEVPDNYKKTSPTYQLGNCKTPTLIHVGGGDERCPPGHSRMLYRALKENLKVPTELVVYTGEPHGLTKMSNRRAKMEWDLAWFDKYLKNAR
jgi:dipeptidyl aminopeptidase/acylaminoacyl peptidase